METEVKAGNTTSEFLVTKIGASVAIAAPLLVTFAASRGYDISAQQIVDLANNALVAVAALGSAYAIGRSLVKARR